MHAPSDGVSLAPATVAQAAQVDVPRRQRTPLSVDGRHFSRGGAPYRIKGVTYGSFRSRSDGALYPETHRIVDDLYAIAASGLNTVRTYTLPPADFLNCADEVGIDVIVGLHYDDWRAQTSTGRQANRAVLAAGRAALDEALGRIVDHPSVVALCVGNEVPVDLVRLHGAAGVEDVLAAIVTDAHVGAPDVLITYANYPTTEFLHVPGLDFTSFNVFLENPVDLVRYLRHLQCASELPVVISELGLGAGVHGDAAQAASLERQLLAVDEAGCAGATVFAWTDEWAVADEPVDGWGFGLTTAERAPKPALSVVRDWATRTIRDLRQDWPKVSVVVCAYNEERHIEKCLDSLMLVDYPDLEVIVCDDGSTDKTRRVAELFPFRLLELPHGGLSAARNAGISAATGEIVAFLDADAFAHPEWPYHLALSLQDNGVAATGGPNLPVENAGLVERAVALAPGAPVEVLVSDDRAEHVPGCNMAFWREDLLAVGGFDPAYTAAGDDVDVCWKLLDRGRAIAFSPAAQVRHRRRGTISGYLRQQRGYGRAERMLSGRHRHRFNRLGQARWAGSIYTGPRLLPTFLRPIVYHGVQASAPYQKQVRQPGHGVLTHIGTLLPIAFVAAVVMSAFAPLWRPSGLAPVLFDALLVAYAALVGIGVRCDRHERQPRRVRALVMWLHLAQPFVRMWGRLRGEPLSPLPSAGAATHGVDRFALLKAVQRELAAPGVHTAVGDAHAAHDLAVTVGPLLSMRLNAAVRWEWFPMLRRRLRLRAGVFVAVAVIATTAAVSTTALCITVATVAADAAYELIRLHRVMARVRHRLSGTPQ